MNQRLAALAPLDDARMPDSPHDEAATALFLAITSESHRFNGKLGTPIFDVPSRSPRRVVSLVAAAVIVAAVLAGTLLVTLGTSPSASASVTLQSLRGVPLQADVPKDTISSHGSIIWSKVPALVIAVSRGAVVGYVKKSDLRPSQGLTGPLQEPVPGCGTDGLNVYNADRLLIGHIYPGTGYIPLRVEPKCPPEGTAPPGGPASDSHSSAVVVPDIRGQTLSQAEQTLLGAGLLTKVVNVTTPGAAAGTVLSEAPVPGATMARGSEVTISVGS